MDIIILLSIIIGILLYCSVKKMILLIEDYRFNKKYVWTKEFEDFKRATDEMRFDMDYMKVTKGRYIND